MAGLALFWVLSSSCAGCDPEPGGTEPDPDEPGSDVGVQPPDLDASGEDTGGVEPPIDMGREDVGEPPTAEVCSGGLDEDSDGYADCDDLDCAQAPECEGISPDLTQIAPQPARGDILERYEFLFDGEHAPQKEVDLAEFDDTLAAHVRGHVVDHVSGAPIPGARVRVLGQPFAGFMGTTTSGIFDLVVHGSSSGQTTLVVDAHGYAPHQTRTPLLPESDIDLGTVRLLPLTPAAPAMSSMSPELQVISGPLVSGARGDRQTTLLMRPMTRIKAVGLDSSETELSQASIRITETSVGGAENGAMNAPLPVFSGYTWAAHFSVDEAMDAARIEFEPSVAVHLDEFLDFPAGTRVPLGYYDEERGIWAEYEAAHVIDVLGVDAGLATLDATGDGVADSIEELEALGITESELAEIAQARQPGESFWRMELEHFSTWDANVGFGCGVDPDARGVSCSGLEAALAAGRYVMTPSCERGSIIECDNRTVSQSLRLMGSSYTLHHRSDWQEGFAERRMLRIPLRPSDLSIANVGALNYFLSVRIAGRVIHDEKYSVLEATQNNYVEIEWDGLDAYGRRADDIPQKAMVTVSITYPSRPSSNGNFNDPDGLPISSSRDAGRDFVGRTARYEVPIEPRFDDSSIEAGGWTLSAYHKLEANGFVRRGDGGIIAPSAQLNRTRVTTQAGVGGPVASLPSGELLIVQRDRCIVRLDPRVEGSEQVVAGSCSEQAPQQTTLDAFAFGEDPTESLFGSIQGIHTSPTGELYIWQTDTQQRWPSVIVRTRPLSKAKGAVFAPLEHVAGNGSYGVLTQERALDARTQPLLIDDLAVSPNAEIYIAQTATDCLVRIGNTGRISQMAGLCETSPEKTTELGYGERLSSLEGYFGQPNAVDVGPDGQIYVARRLMGDLVRITSGEVVEHIAGVSARVQTDLEFSPPVVDDGIDAREWSNGYNGYFQDVVVAGNGDVFVLQDRFNTVRRIDPNNKVFRHTPSLSFPRSLELHTSGELLVNTSPLEPLLFDARTWRIDPDDGSRLIIDPSGMIAYAFDDSGRHIRTEHALSGLILESFVHDENGRLVEIIDRDSRSTLLERDATTGALGAIVGPDGHRTELDYDERGQLAQMTWADGKTSSLEYDTQAQGLITKLVGPMGTAKTYTYDGKGLLETAMDETGATQTYSETLVTKNEVYGRNITRTSPDGRQKTWMIDLRGDHDSGATTLVDGLGRTQIVERSPRSHLAKLATGETVNMLFGSDPHFGSTVTRLERSYRGLPSGASLTVDHAHEVTYDGMDGSRLATQTKRTTQSGVNGEWVSTYDVATRELIVTSPEGRTIRSVFDDKMRLIERQEGALAIHTTTWDEQTGRLLETRITDPNDPSNTRVQTYEYIEAEGQLDTGMLSQITDPIGRITQYEHDVMANLRRVMLPSLNGAQSEQERTIEFEYDDDANLVRLAPFGRDQHVMAWDERGAQTSGSMPSVGNNSGQAGYAWTNDAMMSTVTDASGGTISFTYDPDVRELTTQENSAERKRYTYDMTSGQLTRLEATGKQPWASDRGHEFEYDGSRVLAEHWLDDTGARWASVRFEYDEAFRRDLITVNGRPVIPMEFDNDGLVTLMGPASMTYLADRAQLDRLTIDTVGVGMGYDPFGALTGVSATNGGGTDLLSRVVTRDGLGRIEAVTETSAGQPDVTELYEYDPQGRLAAVYRDANADGVSQPGELFEAYERDERGNEISLLVAGGAISGFTVNAQDQVTAHGDTRLTYNALGQADSIGFLGEPSRALTLEHDPDHVLRRVEFADGTTRTYDLDAFGRQNHIIDRDSNGITTGEKHYLFLQGSNPIAEVNDQGIPLKTFIYASGSNAPDAIVDEFTGETFVLIKDERGSVRVVANAATGDVVQRLTYTSHGLVLSDTNPGFQPFGFHGGMHDERTGLIRFGARHYLPEIGRFIEPDPLGWSGGHTNLYAYAAFDPVNGSDPTGLYGESGLDATFIAYDVFAIMRDNVFGNCDNLAENLLALGADVASLFIPGMVGAGLALRAAMKARWAKRASRACSFTDETTVQMCDGEQRPISEVSVGEYVMARDPDSGEDGCHEVTALHRRHVKEVYELELTDEHGVVQVDQVTGEHPYKVAGGDFVTVDLLEPGVVLEGYEGLLKLTGKTRVQGDFLVYNLSVEGVETFFVGGLGSWVHNCQSLFRMAGIRPGSASRSFSRFRVGGEHFKFGSNHSHQQWATRLKSRGWTNRRFKQVLKSKHRQGAYDLPGNDKATWKLLKPGSEWRVLVNKSGEIIMVGGRKEGAAMAF